MTEGQNNCSAKGKCKFFIGVPTVKGKKVSFCKVGYTQNQSEIKRNFNVYVIIDIPEQ